MNHPGDLLSAHLDGELDAVTRAEVSRHLETCRECREELAAASAVRAALRDLPMVEPPAGFSTAVLPRPGNRPRLLRPIWAWAAAGAAALALAAGLVIGPGVPTDPVDLATLADRHTARVVVEPGLNAVRAVMEGP